MYWWVSREVAIIISPVDISPQFFPSQTSLTEENMDLFSQTSPLKLQEDQVGSKKHFYLESIENTVKPCKSCFQRQKYLSAFCFQLAKTGQNEEVKENEGKSALLPILWC